MELPIVVSCDMIERLLEKEIKKQIGKYPVITITGPRQSGKTTLIKRLFSEFPYFSLENPDTRQRIADDPKGFFSQYGHRLVLDEVQRLPILLSYIQGIVDEHKDALFILSGSQNLLMMESVSQTLAGRATIFYLQPLSYTELKPHLSQDHTATELIWKGGYPRIFDKDLDPERFYQDYIATYVQRDVRQIRNIGDLGSFTRFLGVCAGFIGQTINKQTLSDAVGINRATVEAWLSVLETSFVTYQLQPYFKNFKKRLVKSPKLYFRDTGLACSLLGIYSPEQLYNYYQRGAIFENFAINEAAKAFYNVGRTPPIYFWRDNNQREIDLLINLGASLRPVEIKSSETYRSQFFKHLNWFEQVSDVPTTKPTVIYGGAETIQMSQGLILSWRDIDGLTDRGK